jgi:hypothetical protein
MRYIKYNLEIGYAGCDDEGIISVPNDYDNNDIDNMVHDMAMEHASSWEGDERLCWDSDMSEDEYNEATEHFYDGVCGSWEWVTDEED